jgi:hypothetical protein
VNAPVYTSATAPVWVPTVSVPPVQILWGWRGWTSPRHFH